MQGILFAKWDSPPSTTGVSALKVIKGITAMKVIINPIAIKQNKRALFINI